MSPPGFILDQVSNYPAFFAIDYKVLQRAAFIKPPAFFSTRLTNTN